MRKYARYRRVANDRAPPATGRRAKRPPRPRARYRRTGAATAGSSRASLPRRSSWRTIASIAVTVPSRLALICAVGPCQVSWVEVEGCPGGRAIPDQLVVIERRQRVLVTRRAVRRAERVALDRRGAGAIGVGVRAGAHAYLGPRPSGWLRVGDMMVMGFPLGEGQSGRSVFGGRPRERGGSAMPGAGRGASA